MPKKSKSETALLYLSVDSLDFDPTNPRFGGLMEKKSQNQIQQELMKEPYYAIELVDSLLKNGFIDYEPLVVRQTRGRYTVIEGNRRLAAIREILGHLDRYEGRVEDLREIPVLVFPQRPDKQQQSEMRIYLGVRHLIGFREWPPLSKARFLDRLSKEPGGLDGLIKELRLTKGQVRRFLVPFRLLKTGGFPEPRGEDFWMLGEALSRSGIKNFLQLEVDKSLQVLSYNKKKLDQLLGFVYGPLKRDGTRNAEARVVSDTRELSRLAKVLDSEVATVVLLGGKPLEEAEIHVDTREESLKRLGRARRNIVILVKKLTARSKNQEAKRLIESHKTFDAAVKAFVRRERV